jgi:hypothetical protein
MTGASTRRNARRRGADRGRGGPVRHGRARLAEGPQYGSRIVGDARGTAPDAGGRRKRDATLGVVALLGALALVALPAVLAIADSEVLSVQRDAGWLGSPITRFATLQSLGLAVPLALGVLAAVRNRGRDYGAMAVLVALFGNFLLLRTVLALLVTAVLI